jgi:hypothetical protein
MWIFLQKWNIAIQMGISSYDFPVSSVFPSELVKYNDKHYIIYVFRCLIIDF